MTQFGRYGNKYGGKVKAGVRISPVVTTPYRRQTTSGPSSARFTPHEGTARPSQQYTGDAMLGIGTMHKSNAIPVFSADEATDLAKMRRG